MDARIAAMDATDVTVVLQELTRDLAAAVGARQAVRDEDEARAALAAVLAAGGHGRDVEPAAIAATDEQAVAIGRRLLAELSADEALAAGAEELISDPPRDRQLGADPDQILHIAAVLGALVTWLQTKVSIRIHREGAKSTIDVEVEKESTDPETLQEIAATVRGFVAPGG